MKAILLGHIGGKLSIADIETPTPAPSEVLIKVSACAVCRTDIHVIDGELADPSLPLILGHEVVGTVTQVGAKVSPELIGQRLGVPWLGGSCLECEFCRSGQENLCDKAIFIGYQRNGGYAEYLVADPRFCFPIPETYSDEQAAPLLCAGLIGFRAYRMVSQAKRLGLYGFGASAHIITQIAKFDGKDIYAFTRQNDVESQIFAKSLGAIWAGGSTESPPNLLDAAIIFAPVGSLVPQALAAVKKGGTVICAGIHMSDIPSFPYSLLWGERTVKSVANLTRQDGIDFFSTIRKQEIITSTMKFNLEEASSAIEKLRSGKIKGAAVLIP